MRRAFLDPRLPQNCHFLSAFQFCFLVLQKLIESFLLIALLGLTDETARLQVVFKRYQVLVPPDAADPFFGAYYIDGSKVNFDQRLSKMNDELMVYGTYSINSTEFGAISKTSS